MKYCSKVCFNWLLNLLNRTRPINIVTHIEKQIYRPDSVPSLISDFVSPSYATQRKNRKILKNILTDVWNFNSASLYLF